jgi:hypothetical protein
LDYRHASDPARQHNQAYWLRSSHEEQPVFLSRLQAGRRDLQIVDQPERIDSDAGVRERFRILGRHQING